MTGRLLAIVLAPWLGVALAAPAPSQRPVSIYDSKIDAALKANLTVRRLADIKSNYRLFAEYVAARARLREFLREIEEHRVDEQVGSSVGSGGSTNLVSKGSVPAVLGFAVENGALTQSTGGSAITFRGNVVGISRLISGHDVFPYCPPERATCDDSVTRAIKGVSFSVSFDASRGQTTTAQTVGMAASGSTGAPAQPLTFTGSTRQIAAWGLRYDLFNRRDPNSQEYRQRWDEAMTRQGSALVTAAGALDKKLAEAFDPLTESEKYADWLGGAMKVLQASLDRGASREEFQQLFSEQLLALVDIATKLDPMFEDKAFSALQAFSRYFAARDEILKSVVNKPILTFEYTDNRPLNQPELSNFRLIFANQPKDGKALYTLNVAATIYNKAPASAKVGRWRDFQAAVQGDFPLPTQEFGQPVFTLAGYWQYMQDNALIKIDPGSVAPFTGIPLPQDATVLLAPKGNIGIAQAKITFSVKGSGVKIPIALTWANRTELIKASEVRGNIGLTFDLDSLLLRR